MKANMKSILALLLAAILVLSMSACASKPAEPVKEDAPATTEQTQTEQQPEEKSAEETPAEQTSETPDAERYGGTLDLVWMECNDTMDPQYTTGWASYFWSMYVYENPLVRDADGVVRPNVCEYELSDDGLTLKLWVREGMTFHDGSPVEIEDVVASLERAGHLVKNVRTNFTERIASCEVEDGVVTYTFTDYLPLTMHYISSDQNWAAILPKEICEKYADSPINNVEDAIGTGPYYLDSYESNVCYHMKRYDGYKPIDAEYSGMAAPKMAYMDNINVWINFDSTSIAMSVLSGDYDMYTINPEYYPEASTRGLVQWSDMQYNILPLFFNTKGERPVNDINLRKAIAAALDFEEVAGVEFPEAYMMSSNPMSGEIYATDVFESADWYGESKPELAKEYLDKSDYDGQELVILIDKNNNSICQTLMESQLEAVGINVRLEYMDSNAAKEFYGDPMNEYDMFLQNYVVNSFTPVSISATAKNTFWGNEQKDEYFNELKTTVPGSPECLEIWNKLAELWVEDAAVVNLATITYQWTVPEDLVIQMEGHTWRYFWNCYWKNPSEHMD